jgi:gamma-glutamylaminecyclotransferase
VSHQVFVYGTLKQGFRNFHINHGRRVPGEFVTVQPHVLLIVGDYWLPWLLEESRANSGPREGLRVVGQIYEVDEAGLAAMDKLEQIDEDGWYQRKRVEVKPRGDDDAPALLPWVYFGSREGLARERKHLGPVAEFTEAHQDLLPRHLWPQG